MREKPVEIELAGKQIPLWCDLFVLNEIQNKYESIQQFERDLLGYVKWKGKWYKGKPKVEAILFALPLMIREGIKKKKRLGEVVASDIEDVEGILIDANKHYEVLAELMHEEFKRCFESKK